MSLCPERVSNPRPFRCKRNDLPLIYQDLMLMPLWHLLNTHMALHILTNLGQPRPGQEQLCVLSSMAEHKLGKLLLLQKVQGDSLS